MLSFNFYDIYCILRLIAKTTKYDNICNYNLKLSITKFYHAKLYHYVKKILFVENYNNCINLRFIFLSFEGLIFLSLKTFNFQLLLFKGQVKLNFYRSNFKCVIVNTTYFTIIFTICTIY